MYLLVQWLGEDSVSVVFSGKVEFEGKASVGKECIIKLGKKSYTGEILAIGKSSLSTIVLNSRDRQGMYGMQHFRTPRNAPYNRL